MAMTKTLFAVVLLALVAVAHADVYMHSPRGMNNRCDEQNNNRNNNNRLMNTQNNGAGGYAVAPPMYYHAGSILMLEWTSQHSSGAEGKAFTNVVWQYACADSFKDGESEDPEANGNGNTCTDEITPANEDLDTTGRHEDLAYFEACNARPRNQGLFTADQNMNNNNGAQATRQNNNGGSSGFECQEERDYYPYWHPTPFRDIAILTTDMDRCEYYQAQSENVKGRNLCSLPEFNNEQDCIDGTGVWNRESAHNEPAPECVEAPWGRANALSNDQSGFLQSYNWTIPSQGLIGLSTEHACFVRIRYNISTSDFDSWAVDATDNDNDDIIANNPFVGLTSDETQVTGENGAFLRMAIATSQFGRTFEDRSYTFKIFPAKVTLPFRKVYNLNVRGKRGNIAEVRNCVEYDFVPTRLSIRQGDFVHIQWTGSNHNPKNNAGEGKAGTDRSNMVQLVANDHGANYFEGMDSQRLFTKDDVAYRAAFIHQDYATCMTLEELEQANNDQLKNNCAKLNQPSQGYFNLGVTRINGTTDVNYMSTRNNNFTNRGQKATIRMQLWFGGYTVAVGGAAVLAAVAAVGGAGAIYLVATGGTAGLASIIGASASKRSKSSGSGDKVYKRSASRGSFGTGSNGSKSSRGTKKSNSSFGGSMI